MEHPIGAGRVDFGLVAAAMRDAVIEFYEARGRRLDTLAGRATLNAVSFEAPERARLLLEVLGHAGLSSIDGLRIADLGCGFGPLALFLANRADTVTAVDRASDIIGVGERVARAFELPSQFLSGRMEDLELPSAAFDLVVINNAFCYLTAARDRRRALAHALRVLRPGGFLVMRDPNRLHPIDPFSRLPLVHRLPPGAGSHLARTLGRPRPVVRLASPASFARRLRTAGFSDVTVAGHVGPLAPWLPLRYGRYHHAVARRPLRTPGPLPPAP